MADEFVDMCAFCKQGVLKTDMIYQKGLVFHTLCFTSHGKEFPTPDVELAQLGAMTRIELVQLKNMKVRAESQKQSPAKKKASKKSKKKPKPKKTKPKAKKSKKKAKKSKKKPRRRR
ncbi:MAG: hypothetical protein ACREAX_03885 [Candidatus Nitrosotenuis sp.]